MTLKSVIRLNHVPPSANNLFANVAKRGRIKTAEYRAWLESAGWNLKTARTTKWAIPVNLSIVIGKLRSNADISNRIKACEDLLVLHGIIPDDSIQWVKGVRIEMAEVPFEGVEIEITAAAARVGMAA